MSRRQLSGLELRQQMQWRDDVDRIGALPLRGGLKDYSPDGSWLQEQKLRNFFEERREILREERVQKKGCLAVGEWIKDIAKVLVTKNTGKFWKNFGHAGNGGQQWLYPEEALFLIDEGSLEVYFGGVPLSLQKAYAVLLSSVVPVQHYHVFSHLCRYGYVVRRHSDKMIATRYEQTIGLVERRTSDNVHRRIKKRKLSDVRQDSVGTNDIERSDNKMPKIYNENDDNPCQGTSAPQSTGTDIDVVARGEFRGWFGSEWFHLGFVGNQCDITPSNKLDSSSVSELSCRRLLVDCSFHDLTAKQNSYELSFEPSFNSLPIEQRNHSLSAELLSMNLVAKNWASLKKSQREFLVEDTNWLTSTPHSVLWSGDVKPLVHPSQTISYANMLQVLQIIDDVDCVSLSPRTTEQQSENFRIIYDVFQPDSKFRKSDPGQPSVCLCISRQDDPMPGLGDVLRLSCRCPDGTTLMWSVVDSGDISFYSFNSVNLPADDDFTLSS